MHHDNATFLSFYTFWQWSVLTTSSIISAGLPKCDKMTLEAVMLQVYVEPQQTCEPFQANK